MNLPSGFFQPTKLVGGRRGWGGGRLIEKLTAFTVKR